MRDSIKQKYYTQKSGAKCRNIEWCFTYESWLEWWGDDIVNRGNKSGQLVMARNNDTGPYHPDNVRKVTCNANHSEAHKNGLGGMKNRKHTPESLEKMLAAAKKLRKKHTKLPWTEERKAKVKETWTLKKSKHTSD